MAVTVSPAPEAPSVLCYRGQSLAIQACVACQVELGAHQDLELDQAHIPWDPTSAAGLTRLQEQKCLDERNTLPLV